MSKSDRLTRPGTTTQSSATSGSIGTPIHFPFVCSSSSTPSFVRRTSECVSSSRRRRGGSVCGVSASPRRSAATRRASASASGDRGPASSRARAPANHGCRSRRGAAGAAPTTTGRTSGVVACRKSTDATACLRGRSSSCVRDGPFQADSARPPMRSPKAAARGSPPVAASCRRRPSSSLPGR